MNDTTDLELRARRVVAPAQDALFKVLSVVQTSEINSVYAVRSRVKRVTDVLGKVERKRADGRSDYSPEQITDIVGIRIVTLFREDIIDVLKRCLQLVRHEGSLGSTSPFVKDEMAEGIVYATAMVGDPEAITSRLQSVFLEYNFPLGKGDVRQVETGYSSVHLIVFCSVVHEGRPAKVPIEIQIRTVFEDAWGEVDHKLRYSINRAKLGKNTEKALASWQPHLNVLKTFADGCAQYAGVIKSQAIDLRSRSAEFGPFVPVESAQETLAQLGKCSEDLRKAFEAAYKERGDASKATDKVERGIRFLEAARLFNEAHDQIASSAFENDKTENAASFFSKMEAAFCLLSEGSKASLDEAIQIYISMQSRSPNSVIVYYRYAQALRTLDSIDPAIAQYAKAESLLASDQHVPLNHWLRVLIPRDLGFVKWSKSRLCGEGEDGMSARLSLLSGAFADTCRAYENTQPETLSRTKCANNVLFYAVEYLALRPEGDSRITDESLTPFLDQLEKAVSLRSATLQELNWLDTMCRAYALLKRIDKAVLAAERIEHLLSDPGSQNGDISNKDSRNATESYYAVTRNLNDREREVLDHALWVLRQHGPGPETKGT